jgi:hypothetical protein
LTVTTTPGWDPADPLLPEQSGDDRDEGWGDRQPESDADDLERFLRDRPPHHGD